MNKADIQKAAKGLAILTLNKAVGPFVAVALVTLFWSVIALLALALTAAMLLAIIDTGYLIHSGSHLDWMTPNQRYVTYAAVAFTFFAVALQTYKERGSYIERLKKVVDDNEIQKEKNAQAELARKQLAEKGAYTDKSRNTK